MSFRDFFKDVFGPKGAEKSDSKSVEAGAEAKLREAENEAKEKSIKDWQKIDAASGKKQLEADKKVLHELEQRKIDKLDRSHPGWEQRAISADDREIMGFKKEAESKKSPEGVKLSESQKTPVPVPEKGSSAKVEKGVGDAGPSPLKENAKPQGAPETKPSANPSPVSPAKEKTVDLSPVKAPSADNSKVSKIGQNAKPVAIPETKPSAKPAPATPVKPGEVDLSPVKGASASNSDHNKIWQERELKRRAQPAETDDYRARGRVLGDTQEKTKALQAVKQKQGNMHKCNTDVKMDQTTQAKSNPDMVKGKWTAKVVSERQGRTAAPPKSTPPKPTAPRRPRK